MRLPRITFYPKRLPRKALPGKRQKKTETAKSKSVAKKTSKPDDLRKIEGIGPKISQVLVANGIDTYAKIAAMKAQDIKAVLEKDGVKIAFPETWPQQAKLAANDDWDGLTKLQDSLKGGRKA